MAKVRSGQNMTRTDNTARRLDADVTQAAGIARGPGLRAVSGAGRQFTRRAVAEVGLQIRTRRRAGAGLALLQRPLLLGGVDQAQFVDARVHLRGSAGAHKVGDGDGGQQTDNRDDDHDFDKGET